MKWIYRRYYIFLIQIPNNSISKINFICRGASHNYTIKIEPICMSMESELNPAGFLLHMFTVAYMCFCNWFVCFCNWFVCFCNEVICFCKGEWRGIHFFMKIHFKVHIWNMNLPLTLPRFSLFFTNTT